MTVAAARVRLQVALEQALDAVAHCAVLHRARVLQPHLHLQPLGDLRGHPIQQPVVVHRGPQRLLRVVPIHRHLALSHPALLLALQLLTERCHIAAASLIVA